MMKTLQRSHVIFRLCMPEEWATLQQSGEYAGNVADVQDGFIHASAADQVAGTAEKYYPVDGQLILLAVSVAAVEADLKWEESRGGALFPHLFAKLPLSAVAAWRALDDRDFDFLNEPLEITEALGWTCIL